MDVTQVLKEHKVRVEEVLEQYFNNTRNQYINFPEYIQDFVDHTAEFTLRGGKRVRPALLYYGYQLFSNQDLDEVVKISIFIELLHSFLLIHDDIMDRSDLRRGLPTVHKIYEGISRKEGFNDDTHLGNTMAILSGDFASQLAYGIIAESNFPEDKKNKLIKLVSEEISSVIFGQIGDCLLPYKKNFTREDVEYVHLYKTATYTFRLPLLAGAILAGAEEQYFSVLENYAIPCGIAFQIRDDILGVFGVDKDTGKSSISDIEEGKKTLLVHHAYQYASEEDKAKLDTCIGKQGLVDTEAMEVREIFRRTGSLDYSIERCREKVDQAKNAVMQLSEVNTTSVEFLENLAEYMIVREI